MIPAFAKPNPRCAGWLRQTKAASLTAGSMVLAIITCSESKFILRLFTFKKHLRNSIDNKKILPQGNIYFSKKFKILTLFSKWNFNFLLLFFGHISDKKEIQSNPKKRKHGLIGNLNGASAAWLPLCSAPCLPPASGVCLFLFVPAPLQAQPGCHIDLTDQSAPRKVHQTGVGLTLKRQAGPRRHGGSSAATRPTKRRTRRPRSGGAPSTHVRSGGRSQLQGPAAGRRFFSFFLSFLGLKILPRKRRWSSKFRHLGHLGHAVS